MMQDAESVEQSRSNRIKQSDLREEQLREQDSEMKQDTLSQGQFIRKATQDLLDGSVENLRRGRA
jgi:hypothetical protein